MSSIREIVTKYEGMTVDGDVIDLMTRELVEREAELADHLRAHAEQWGLHAPIVAENLAEVGIGRPLSAAERGLIHQTFEDHIRQLQAQAESGQEPGEDGV